jgi:hypothetical protein
MLCGIVKGINMNVREIVWGGKNNCEEFLYFLAFSGGKVDQG